VVRGDPRPAEDPEPPYDDLVVIIDSNGQMHGCSVVPVRDGTYPAAMTRLQTARQPKRLQTFKYVRP
jgi:hypothetical protein